LHLYRRLGFVPFGPRVGSGEAVFQPMYSYTDAFAQKTEVLFTPTRNGNPVSVPVSFLPGPVGIHEDVRDALDIPPISHRGGQFCRLLQSTKQILTDLTQARRVEILLGSGSLANDIVAGQIWLLKQPGLVLSNGEFGERLIDHAERFGIPLEPFRADWGAPFDLAALGQRLRQEPPPGWLWVAHCETSTSVMNDLDALRELCNAHGVKLCLDGISSIGNVPVDLRGCTWPAPSAEKA